MRIASIFAAAALACAYGQPRTVVVRPAEIDDVLVNPAASRSATGQAVSATAQTAPASGRFRL